MSAPTRDELAELRSFTVSTVNDALRLLNFKDSLLDYIAALEAQNQKLREALTELLFWIYPTEGEDLRKHDQFTDCAMDCYRLVEHDRAPEFFRAVLAATEPKEKA